MKKTVEVVIPTFNEEQNVDEIYSRIQTLSKNEKEYDFRILFIDNCSTDKTQEKLRILSDKDKNVKLIFNQKNFGSSKSHYWGIMNTSSDIVIVIAGDLQEPPELISTFLRNWEKGFKIVMGVKKFNFSIGYLIRKTFYLFLKKISEQQVVPNSTGFGLYDKVIIDELKKIYEPYPFFRSLALEFGYPVTTVEFDFEKRKEGKSKISIFELYQIGISGIINNSMIPIRVSSFLGILIGVISIIISILFLVLKIIYWHSFSTGYAPIIITLFFLMGLIFIFLGLLGEYIGSTIKYLKKRPLVIEKERINF